MKKVAGFFLIILILEVVSYVLCKYTFYGEWFDGRRYFNKDLFILLSIGISGITMILLVAGLTNVPSGLIDELLLLPKRITSMINVKRTVGFISLILGWVMFSFALSSFIFPKRGERSYFEINLGLFPKYEFNLSLFIGLNVLGAAMLLFYFGYVLLKNK